MAGNLGTHSQDCQTRDSQIWDRHELVRHETVRQWDTRSWVKKWMTDYIINLTEPN